MVRILIVDDAQIMRSILSVVLEKAGYEIVGRAANRTEALEMYNEFNPDLVTMDIQMAGGDGLACLREIMQLHAKAKVIMVSAQGHGQKETEARNFGAIGYVAKPFQTQDILAEIQNALAA